MNPFNNAGHPCGDSPRRVPSRMQAHVRARADTYKECFAAQPNGACGVGWLFVWELQHDGAGALPCMSLPHLPFHNNHLALRTRRATQTGGAGS